MLEIGRSALTHHLNYFEGHQKDLDFIGTLQDVTGYIDSMKDYIQSVERKKGGHYIIKDKDPTRPIIEIEVAREGSSSADLLNLYSNPTHAYADLNTLYMLKMSHRYKKNSPHFLKTMNDILNMRERGAIITPELRPIYKKRKEETYNYAHPNLNTTKKEFFDPNSMVPYKYDHDSIHRAVAYPHKPAYEYYKPDINEVACSKELFDKQPMHIKLRGVLEEAYVLSLERYLIPNNFNTGPYSGFLIALEKICTSITSGWFREWAWEHYYQVRENYDKTYVQKFHKAKAAGLILPFKQEN